MKMIARLIASGLLFVAAGNATAGGWTTPGKIQKIVFSDGKAGVLIEHDFMSDTDGCGRQDFFILPSSNLLFKEMYSLLLSAQLVGQPLNLHLTGCSQGLPVIVNIVSANN